MKRQAQYTTDPREAYDLELKRMQIRLDQIRDKLHETFGEGVPENINWGDVGSAKMVNQILGEVLMINL
jgi:hypothetical protein